MVDDCRTVYAVSGGSYSSYGVVCLFDTLELANAYCARLNEVTFEVQQRITELDELPYGELSYSEKRRWDEEMAALMKTVRYSSDRAFVERFQVWSSLPVC